MSTADTPPVVLVPGLNNSPASWEWTADQLRNDASGAPLRVFAVDCPAIDDVDTIATEVALTIAEPSVIVGHSFGGYVALALLANRPDLVAGLVLVNSGTGADTEAAAAGRAEKAAQADAGGYAEIADAASANAYHPDNLGRADLVAARQRSVAEYGAARYAAHQRAAAKRPDRTATAAEAAVRRLVVASSDDRVIPTDRQRQTAADIGADFTVIDGAGHMLPVERPAELAAAVAAFVRSIAGSGRQPSEGEARR